MFERQEYAWVNRYLYLGYAQEVAKSPFDALARTEFALISAHTRFEPSVKGFLATRGVTGVDEMGSKLWSAGVLAPYMKAVRIASLRDGVEDGLLKLPYWREHEWRRTNKLPGLGYCKGSFAASLCNPLNTTVVCLDTHVLSVYNRTVRVYNKLAAYEEVEALLSAEALEVGLPPFPYQWAVWDWKRGLPSPHDFLWQEGMQLTHLPLFSSREGLTEPVN